MIGILIVHCPPASKWKFLVEGKNYLPSRFVVVVSVCLFGGPFTNVTSVRKSRSDFSATRLSAHKKRAIYKE